MSTEPIFAFERLDTYQRAVDFVALSARLIAELPAGNATLTHQLERAALAVPVNIAEGVGRVAPADRRKHYAIARGSAMECAAILDAIQRLAPVCPALLSEGRGLLLRIVQMLTKLCQ